MYLIDKLIEKYEKDILEIDKQRKLDDKAGDHSFTMQYDAEENKISEFIEELKNINS